MKALSLRDLKVYQEAILCVTSIYATCRDTKLCRDYSLCDQIKRASTSVVANIAEGHGRKTKADFSHFLSISLGSANEVIAFLDIIKQLHPWVETDQIRLRYEVLCKRIYVFRKNLY